MDNFRYIRSFKVTAVVQRDTIFMHDKTKVLCTKLPQWPTSKKQKIHCVYYNCMDRSFERMLNYYYRSCFYFSVSSDSLSSARIWYRKNS